MSSPRGEEREKGQGCQVDALLTSQLNQQLAKDVARGSRPLSLTLSLSLSLPSSDVVIDLSGDNLANKQAKPSVYKIIPASPEGRPPPNPQSASSTIPLQFGAYIVDSSSANYTPQ